MRREMLIIGCATAVSFFSFSGASGSNTDIKTGTLAYWRAGAGDWADPAQWRNGIVPGLGLEAPSIFIDPYVDVDNQASDRSYNAAGDKISSHVTLSLDVHVGNIYLGSGDLLEVFHGGEMTFDSTTDQVITVFNAGEINIAPSSTRSGITVSGGRSLLLSGDGRITLTHSTLATITGGTGSEVITISGGVVEGAGLLGGGTLRIVNLGVIEANRSYQRLTVEPSAGGITNLGALRAVNSSRLLLRNSMVDNSGGAIEAFDASVVDLENSTILRGAIRTDEDSAVRALNAPAAMHDVSITGNVEIGQVQLTLGGTVTNNGTIICVGDDSARGASLPVFSSQIVVAPGGAVLAGSGRLALIKASVWSGQENVNADFVNGAGHVIAGRGNIGNDTLCMINQGTIIADGETPIILDPCDSTPFINEGTLLATGDGVMYFVDGSFQNQGTIEVREGGQVVLLPGASLINSATGGLLDGIWIIRGSYDLAELILLVGGDLSMSMADVTLDGLLSRFDRLNAMQYNFGAFRLLNGRVFTSIGDFTNAGVLEIDSRSKLTSPGRITLNGASHVILEVSADSSGALVAGTRAALAGVLEIVLAPGTAWENGRNIQIITAPQITGQFQQVIAPGDFDLSIVAGGMVITPEAPCAGDFDGDDVVNIADLLFMLDQWGVCDAGDECPCDLDGSGHVNVYDLIVLLDVWGNCP